LNYSMYKEAALRKKLADMGIPNQGQRHLLERRHKEWTMLWNANCDAAQPKARSELLKDLDVWERTQGGRAPVTGRAAQNAAIIKDKDFDGSAWAAQYDNSFKDLIANARKSRLEAKKKVEEPGEGEQQRSETEADPNPPPPQDNVQHLDAVAPGQVRTEALTNTDWDGQYDPQVQTEHRASTMPP
jgi:E3 ubiquitin-protein ligase RAD18